MKKILLILLSVVFVLSLAGTLAFADQPAADQPVESITRYIKNSYTSGAYLFEDNGQLKYGIPISEKEQQFVWEFVEHDGDWQIKNAATGHSISVSDGGGQRTAVKQVDNVTSDELWKLDPYLYSDEDQNIASVSTDYKGYALHIIELTDGYVACEELGSQLSYGEAQWLLCEASEVQFEGVIRDGFCIGFGNGWLNADSLTFVEPTGPDDNFVWKFELNEDGTKLIYNLGKQQYMTVSGNSITLGDKENATRFSFSVSASSKLVTGDSGISASAAGLSVTTARGATELDLTLASVVGTVLGDLKLDGEYAFVNSWFEMYMLEDAGIPTYGNSSLSDSHCRWQVIYDEQSGNSALKNVGADGYLVLEEGKLVFVKQPTYFWKALRSSNDLYPNAIRFQVATDSKQWLHMENLTGQLECSGSVQGTWGSPHWEPMSVSEGTQATVENTSVQADKWFRFRSQWGDGLYFYQTNGGFAYGSAAESDMRSHWKFVKDGDSYVLYNRNYDTYLSDYGNGNLNKTTDISEATHFNVKKYLADDSLIIYSPNAKDYLSQYINIKNRDSFVHLSLVSTDIKESRWIFEDAPEEVDSNEIIVNNTVLSTFTEQGAYNLDGKIVKVEHYNKYVRIKSNGKFLYVNNKGRSSWRRFTHDYDTGFYFDCQQQGDDIVISHGDFSATLQQTGTDRTFVLSDGLVSGNQSTLSVYAAQSGRYTVRINSTQDGISNTVYVDGIAQITFRTGETQQFDLDLHQGNNLVKFTRKDAIAEITVCDIVSNGYLGATDGAVAYELEQGSTNAEVYPDSREYRTLESESSARSFVMLSQITEYVEVTLTHPANAMTLRYSVPDSADGQGKSYTLSLYVDKKEVDDLQLNSEHTHLYGEFPWTNNPQDGNEHVWYDELTYRFDHTLSAGTVVRFRRDFDDEASYYALDLMETEMVPEKIEKPADALSVVDFGAVPNDGEDDTAAFEQCIAAASSSVPHPKEVYIPEGVFEVHKILPIRATGLTIRGAGWWYSVVNGLQFSVGGNDFSVYSLKVQGDSVTRRDEEERAFVEMATNGLSGLTLANNWITHYKVGAWLVYVDKVHASGNRIRYTYADGINLHMSVTDSVVENNNMRSTGDDGLAEWSDTIENKNLTLRYNTIENPWLANCIALYGGTDISVYNNICKDNAYVGAGVNVSNNFVPTNFKGALTVRNNLMLRCGSDDNSTGKDVGAIWFNMIMGYDAYARITISNNVILNSTHQGISFYGGSTVCSLVLEENVISDSGSYGIDISSDFTGNMYLRNNAIVGSALEDVLYGYSERNATVVVADDQVTVNEPHGAEIALWTVGGVLLASAVALGTLVIVKFVKNRRAK